MQISEFAAQIHHYDRHRELQDVPKEPVEDHRWIVRMVDSFFKTTRQQDNDPRDYDPLNGRILRWASGQATSATYQITPQKRRLDRIDVAYKNRYLYRIHQQGQTLDVLDTFLSKDGQSRLECWHLDLENPDKSFYQWL